MSEIDLNKLFQTAVLLTQYKDEKTISSKTIQYAFLILYMNDNDNYKKAISNATKYVTYYHTEQCKISEFKKASTLKKTLRDYLNQDYLDLRIGNSVDIYLCGLVDFFDKSYNEQLQDLGKKNKEKN